MEQFNLIEVSYYGLFACVVFPYGALIAIGYISPWWIKLLIALIYAAVFFYSVHRFDDDDNEDVVEADQHDVYHAANGFRPFLTMGYICISSILVSVVFKVGNTFILQAVDLNPKFWFITIDIVSLPVIKEFSKATVGCITCSYFLFGLGSSMTFATLCCVTAAKVETRRIGMVVSAAVVDDGETRIPMTRLWLVPQYVLLGFAEKSFDDHLQHGLKEVMGDKT